MSQEDCQFLIVQGPGRYDFIRLPKPVKLADKICNVRDVAASPPRTWPLRRRRQYFDWARAVVRRMHGTHRRLERLFEEAYRLRH